MTRTVITDRDAGLRIIATATDYFLGTCSSCKIPLREETQARGNTALLPCPTPDCGGLVKAGRLSATLTADECDSRCMGAVGPICSCACGGANHGGSWGPRMRQGETFTEALQRYQERLSATEARRAVRREQERNRAERAYVAWAQDNEDLVAFLTDEENCTFDFLDDMRLYAIVRRQPLSDRQAAGVRKCIAKRQQWAKRDAQRAAEREAAKPVPTGKVTVVGTVLSVQWRDNPHGPGGTLKMRVQGDDGWVVWSTCPSGIKPTSFRGGDADHHFGLRGARVQFDATVKASDDDPKFGFASRPTKAKVLSRP